MAINTSVFSLSQAGNVGQQPDERQNFQAKQFELQEAFRKRDAMSRLQANMGKYDLNTSQGRQSFTSDAFKQDIGLGVEVASHMSGLNQQQTQLKEQHEQIEAQALSGLLDEWQTLAAKGPEGVSPQAYQEFTNKYRSVIKSLREQGAITDQDMASIPATFDPGKVMSYLYSTKSGREIMTAKREAMATQSTEAHQREMERQGQERIDKGLGATDALLDEQTVNDMADQYLSGDKSVLQNLGRGKQGAENVVKLRKAISDRARAAGMSPKAVAAAQAEFEGFKAGERTVGTRSANIQLAGDEAYKLADLAGKASEEWKRTGIKTLNDLEKFAQGKTASPTLRRFVAANTSFINAYARAINPQGVGTVADKEHAREMLEVAFAKGDYAAAIDQLKSEIDVAQSAPSDVKKKMREGFTGTPTPADSSHPQDVQDILKKYPPRGG